jgi:hypothetical protein
VDARSATGNDIATLWISLGMTRVIHAETLMSVFVFQAHELQKVLVFQRELSTLKH